MDLSKLKLDIYDFLGILIPGFLGIAEVWVTLKGWTDFQSTVPHISGTQLTLLLLLAFAVGHLIQEFGDVLVQLLKGKRYLQAGRDEFWESDEAQLVRQTITLQLGCEISSVDGAYDYCLTKLQGHFDKRGVFMATSDMCRSFVAISAVGLAPICRVAFLDIVPLPRSLLVLALALGTLSVVTALSWRRMTRYRKLAEATVFRAYLGLNREEAGSTSGALE